MNTLRWEKGVSLRALQDGGGLLAGVIDRRLSNLPVGDTPSELSKAVHGTVHHLEVSINYSHSTQNSSSKYSATLHLTGQQVAHVAVFCVCRHAAHHIAWVDIPVRVV